MKYFVAGLSRTHLSSIQSAPELSSIHNVDSRTLFDFMTLTSLIYLYRPNSVPHVTYSHTTNVFTYLH